MTDNISRLCAWYQQQYVPETNEDVSIKISTLDNPGWSFKVGLKETNLEGRPLDDLKIDRSKSDWIVARQSGSTFEAFGGLNNLDEMIDIFLKWAS